MKKNKECVWNVSDSMREEAVGNNFHKIQQKKVELILKCEYFSSCAQHCRALIPTYTNGVLAQKRQKLKNKQSHMKT